MYPVEKITFSKQNFKTVTFDFDGTGFLIRGNTRKKNQEKPDYVFDAELYIDDVKMETARLPTDYTTRRYELFWKYELPDKKHKIEIKILNPNDDYEVNTSEYFIYKDHK
jgi:FMN phosphatase YigB (HAD superfamily)